MNRKLLRTPTIKWEFLRTRPLVTLRSQHAGPRKCPISNIPLPSLQWMLFKLSGFVRKIPPPGSSWPLRSGFQRAILREEEFLIKDKAARRTTRVSSTERRRLNGLSRTCLRRRRTKHLWWPRLGGLWCYHSFRIPFGFSQKKSLPPYLVFILVFIDIEFEL